MRKATQPEAHLSEKELAVVKDLWSASPNNWRAEQRVHWTQHPEVQARFNFLTSGRADRDRYEHIVRKYFPRLPVARALTLGCGHGEAERGLSKYRFALRHDGIDIADGAIDEARRQARAHGLSQLRYAVADLNSVELPRFAYDVIFGFSSIHHVARLEHLLIEVSKALKPNGYLILDEYVGPNQFQFPDSQVEIINQQIESMPARFRMHVLEPHLLKGGWKRPTIEEMNSVDPSEAIRSDEILTIVSWFFDVVEVHGQGGSLLMAVLEHIAGNFTEDDPESMAYLRLLFERENQLIASGKLHHDFATVIARKRTRWRTWVRYFSNRLSGPILTRSKDRLDFS